MKKFTSLFALLSCLGVYNAHAEGEVTVYVYGSYPQYQCLYWFNATEASPAWNHDQGIEPPKFTDLGEGTIVKDGDTFYKKTLTPEAGKNINVIFSDPGNNGVKTDDIELTGSSEYYFYYFGDDRYFTTSPINLYIVGDFNSWTPELFEKRQSMTTWTTEVDASDNDGFIQFKISLNGTNNNDYKGWGEVKLDNPNNWFYSNNSGNILAHGDYCDKYKITATWEPSSNFQDGQRWTLKIEGIAQTENLVITDGQNYYYPGYDNYIIPSASYYRNCTDNWGTLCLPFEIKNSYEGVTFYKLSSVDRTNKTLSFTSISTVAAGEPVVYKVADGINLDINETDVLNAGHEKEGETVDGWTLHGTWQRIDANAMNAGEYLYFFSNNKFWQAPSSYSVNVPAFRAYFLATEDLGDNATQAPYRIQTDDVEGLQFVEQEDGTVKAYYDLQGRKLDSARKGLVIENGKIIMIK